MAGGTRRLARWERRRAHTDWSPGQTRSPRTRTASRPRPSLYKTLTYVTGATLTDQIWCLLIASDAATTGGLFFAVNAATSSMMTYSYEYMWAFCCELAPGPDGIVPVSATKAII
jgi:hypothetical protein